MGKYVVAGATGLIGQAYVKHLLANGHQVVALVRKKSLPAGVVQIEWDGVNFSWSQELEGADVAVNLAGAPITLKWTPENRKLIRVSRVNSTLAFARAFELSKNPPGVWLNGSAVGFYGDTGDEEVDEFSPAGSGFLGDVCRDWEDAAQSNKCRIVKLRTGIVLAKGGGAFQPLLALAKAFLGGQAGSGKQYMPWVHIEDYLRMLDWCVSSEVVGPVNLCAVEPVTNAEFMATLRKVLGRPWSPPAPALALKLVGALTGPDADVLLTSSRVLPRHLKNANFEYRYRMLDDALFDLVWS